MILLLILFAQLQVSHFVRPVMPHSHEWTKFDKYEYQGDFVLPKSGKWILRYESLYPGKYDGQSVLASCAFDDRIKPGYGNQIPIYDIDESYDHISVQAKPGSHWWYSCTIAVRKEKQ
jgi:hypothetical protein